MALVRVLLAGLLALQIGLAASQDFVPVPPLQTRVTDQIGMLSASQRATLENVLKEVEARSGSQIAILLMSSTAPEAIEQYSIRVADQWKLGRKGLDDGVLLIVAKDNPPALRRLRIEAFRGVQGSLTDAQSKRIIDDVIAPHFRQGDFYGGLTAAVSAIVSLIEAEDLPGPAAQEEDDGFSIGFFLFIVILFFLLSRRRGRRQRFHQHGWRRSVPGVILGGGIGHEMGGGFGGHSGGFGGGGFSGGGGGADGGGASGNW